MNVNYIEPEQHDIDRAKAMKKASDASKQAKTITNMVKLVRRTKAVIAVWGGMSYGSDMIDPFIEALKRNNFSYDEIKDIIRGYRVQVPAQRKEVAPLSDLKARVKDLL